MLRRICIDHAYCKGCGLCIDQCPKKVLEISITRNAQGYLIPKAERPEDCTGCGVCEMICPDMALTVETCEDET